MATNTLRGDYGFDFQFIGTLGNRSGNLGFAEVFSYTPNVTVLNSRTRTTNLDETGLWGEPIPILWGHTRVSCPPVWSSVPQNRAEIPDFTNSASLTLWQNLPPRYG